MTPEKIAKLVAERNTSAEEFVAYQAKSLIREIADAQKHLQAYTEKANAKIAGYRKDLAELTVETVTVAQILGEGCVG